MYRIIPKNEKEVYSLRYTDFIMPMVKAMQEQQKMIDSLQSTIDNLKAENNNLKAENTIIKSDVQKIKEQLGMGLKQR